MNPEASIVVASMRCGEPLRNLLDSIKQFTPDIYEIVLVTPALPAYLGKSILEYNKSIRIIEEPVSGGCVKSFNAGFRSARGKYLVNLNDDCLVTENWLTTMLQFISDGDVQGAFYIQEPPSEEFFVNRLWGKLYGNFSCVRKDLAESIGLWDDNTFIHYGADPDFSLKMWKAGYLVAATPGARVKHLCINDAVRKEHLRDAAGTKLQEKWRGIYYFG